MPRLVLLLCALASMSCASLSQLGLLIQPPHFSRDPDRPAELRLLGPSSSRPTGGAGVRLWARVRNPNAFGLRLGTLDGELYLDGSRAAGVDLPLGLPLRAGEDAVVPIDVNVDFEDVPGLLGVFGRVVSRSAIGYRLEGTVGVDAGQLGQPRFGPMTLLEGDVQPRR
jgi:hypothetical protein